MIDDFSGGLAFAQWGSHLMSVCPCLQHSLHRVLDIAGLQVHIIQSLVSNNKSILNRTVQKNDELFCNRLYIKLIIFRSSYPSIAID